VSRVLFILKRREDYNSTVHSHIGLSTGLFNSASFMQTMLVESGIEAQLSVLADNNAIDRAVTEYKPTHVIVEALWVVPQKFTVLKKLHPDVTWIIRLHSEMPFMAGEGMAMDWLGDYSDIKNVLIACNAPRMLRETREYIKHRNQLTDQQVAEKVIYLPNYYPINYKTKQFDKNKDHVDIGCFGAIRPLKNHLMQALASIEFADSIGKKLRFHVNAGRIEMNGSPVINNLKGLFQQIAPRGHQLVNHQWTPREQFLELCGQMDIGLQVSFSETFNIVGCDLISQGVPLVGSTEIPWASPIFCADATNSEDICAALERTYNWPRLNVWLNKYSLSRYVKRTELVWTTYFKD